MPTFTWWIDEPQLKGSANPTDEDLAELRVQGFATALSLLEEDEQPARYDKASARGAGWSIDSIPVEEGLAPSLDQIRESQTDSEQCRSGRRSCYSARAGWAARPAWAPLTGLRRVFHRAMRSLA